LEKRLPLALLLSFLIIVAWSTFGPKPPPGTSTLPDQVDAGAAQEQSAGPSREARELVAERQAAESEEELTYLFDTGAGRGLFGRFTNRGARLLSLKLGDFSLDRELPEEDRDDSARWVELLSTIEGAEGATGSLVWAGDSSSSAMLTEPLEEALWNSRELAGGGIEFSYAPGTGMLFKKRILPGAGAFQLRLELELENTAAADMPGLAQFTLTPAEVVRPIGEERFYQEPQTIAAWRGSSGEIDVETAVQKEGGSDLRGALAAPRGGRLSFAGVHNKFFALLFSPADEEVERNILGVGYRRVQDEGWLFEHPGQEDEAWKYVVCDVSLQLDVPPLGGSKTWAFDLYAGPKRRTTLAAIDEELLELLDEDVGMFSSIANIITAILGFYYGLLGNWGWAIILMTFTVRVLLFPLNRRFQTAMARYAKKMKRVQPMIDEVKEKHKNNPKRLREEQSRIMQEEGAIPPLGGCLPMFLQFPIFIGLFQALRVDFNLRHEPFILWMRDLSMPDQLAHINFNTYLPFIGTIEYLNILPLLMICLWIAQHKVMPQPENSGPDQERMKKMMMGMQVFFAFLFYSYASGLALYMITSSSIAIFETVVIKKVWPIDDSEMEKKKPGRFMQRVAAMQKEQLRRAKDEGKRKKQQKKKHR